MKWMSNSMKEATIYRFRGWRMRRFDEFRTNKRANRNVKLVTRLEVWDGEHLGECASQKGLRGVVGWTPSWLPESCTSVSEPHQEELKKENQVEKILSWGPSAKRELEKHFEPCKQRKIWTQLVGAIFHHYKLYI
jgi:hypothetical protein